MANEASKIRGLVEEIAEARAGAVWGSASSEDAEAHLQAALYEYTFALSDLLGEGLVLPLPVFVDRTPQDRRT